CAGRAQWKTYSVESCGTCRMPFIIAIKQRQQRAGIDQAARLHLAPLLLLSREHRAKPCTRLLGALGISARNATDGGGGRLSEPLLQRFLVLDIRVLAEPSIDGFIE